MDTIAPVTMTLVSCVGENSDHWYREAQNLVISVRRFGGALAESPVVVNFVDGMDSRYEAGLARLGAEVRVVPRFDPRTPASNKLRMLELAETHDFDVLLAIDTDTVVIGDVSRYGSAAAVAIKPENLDPYPPGCWRRLYAELGVPEPSQSIVTTVTGQVTYPYFNSGVVFVPRDYCAQLLTSWSKRVFDVLDIYERRPDIVPAPQRHWTNQLSLALAVVGDGIPVSPLPVAANLSTTVRVHPLFAHEVTPPFVLHYHNEIDERGYLFRSTNRLLNPLLDAFNLARAETLGLSYDGLPDPPLVRRILRRIEGRAWYEHGPVAAVRRHRLLAPVRRQAKRLASG
jgi:hypothetical protein